MQNSCCQAHKWKVSHAEKSQMQIAQLEPEGASLGGLTLKWRHMFCTHYNKWHSHGVLSRNFYFFIFFVMLLGVQQILYMCHDCTTIFLALLSVFSNWSCSTSLCCFMHFFFYSIHNYPLTCHCSLLSVYFDVSVVLK